MKKLSVVALALAAFLCAPMPALAKEPVFAYANLQKALNESDGGAKAKEALNEELKKQKEAFNGKQEELKKLRDEIDKKSSVMTKEAKEAREQEFKNKSQDFQRQFMESNDKLNAMRQEKEDEIVKELLDVVDEIAKKKGYTYVFERSAGGILYAPPEADITDEVIKSYNKRAKGKK
jgi:outer membrane protein